MTRDQSCKRKMERASNSTMFGNFVYKVSSNRLARTADSRFYHLGGMDLLSIYSVLPT
jgi:hypothetical protein